MISFLKNPYPTNYGQKQSLVVALLVGCFVAAFLYFFKPFGIDDREFPFSYYLGYGAITFAGVVLIYFCAPHIFRGYFNEKRYTVGKEIVLSCILILTIGCGNALFENFTRGRSASEELLTIIFKTFLIGIFPLTFLSLIEYSSKLKKNLKISKEISLPPTTPTSESRSTPIAKYIKLSSEGEEKTIETDNLLYIEAVGNYASVVELNKDSLSKNLFRTTLKALEEDNTIEGVMRCHRSYIVNLNKVHEVKGNAQGLKLHLADCSEIVPVSRKYIQAVKAYFQNLA